MKNNKGKLIISIIVITIITAAMSMLGTCITAAVQSLKLLFAAGEAGSTLENLRGALFMGFTSQNLRSKQFVFLFYLIIGEKLGLYQKPFQ